MFTKKKIVRRSKKIRFVIVAFLRHINAPALNVLLIFFFFAVLKSSNNIPRAPLANGNEEVIHCCYQFVHNIFGLGYIVKMIIGKLATISIIFINIILLHAHLVTAR